MNRQLTIVTRNSNPRRESQPARAWVLYKSAEAVEMQVVQDAGGRPHILGKRAA
jgi:hypothetical protein